MMVSKNLMDMLDSTCTQAAKVASKVGILESTRHLRNSGAELLRAVRCSLDEVIDLLDPRQSGEAPVADADKVD